MAAQLIYQFYSELADYEPKIWRRFQVPRDITMSKRAYILMTMYEMHFRLKKVPRIYMDLYEYECAPSPGSMDILEHVYMANKPSSKK